MKIKKNENYKLKNLKCYFIILNLVISIIAFGGLLGAQSFTLDPKKVEESSDKDKNAGVSEKPPSTTNKPTSVSGGFTPAKDDTLISDDDPDVDDPDNKG